MSIYAVHRVKKRGSLRKHLVLWPHKKTYYQREERGRRGDERETLKELECFVPALPASNTFNNETGNKTHWHLHTHIHAHTQMRPMGRCTFSSRLY